MSNIYVILKAAISVDGFLGSKERLIISGPEDREEVLKLRDTVDAVLIGAGTLRADNPSLLGKSKKPLRVVLSKSADFKPGLNLLNDNQAKTLVFHSNAKFKDKTEYLYYEQLDLETVLEELSSRGVQRLLVEGGADVLNQFYVKGLFNELRLSVGSQYLGKQAKPLILDHYRKLKLVEVKILEQNAVHLYAKC